MSTQVSNDTATEASAAAERYMAEVKHVVVKSAT
jgi:hypothetical protein